VPYLYFFLTEE
jgi:hypothetical protein